MIRIIGIGNRVMGDDGVALKVLEEIQDKIKLINEDIEIIIGETDFIYCLNKINDNDFIIIVDSTCFDLKPGKVTLLSFEQARQYLNRPASQHQFSLVNIITAYRKSIKGCIIGIEVFNLDFGLNLSNVLISRFDEICNKVLNNIKNILENIEAGEYNA
ncbi:hydrogenase maturation protease [Maledivibacter halophilus]|uniref:Hydrogenase maturation protease n=1 Tax=Maledivibacter halophilus TaxID=36842 RepID=A0A1T5L9H3_9FIRM|nr:hydrogenase maturation protease [Maledivibacter halophilus]SKC72613.1 hydrogenase maturation protease [Maledivibacter halophilus]